LWGLAHSGQTGVNNIIQLLKKELDLAMALSGKIMVNFPKKIYLFIFQLGCSSINEIDSSLVIHQDLISRM